MGDDADAVIELRACALCGTVSAAWVQYPAGVLCGSCDTDAAALDQTPTPEAPPALRYDAAEQFYREWGGEG